MAIADYQDQEAIRLAKREHNGGMLRAIDQMRAAGIEGTMAGASNCTLCARCKILDNAPCPFPERRFSCMSAYCVFVRKLAERCGMAYAADGGIAFFGLFAFAPGADSERT